MPPSPNATVVGVGCRRSPDGALPLLRLVPAGGDAVAIIIGNRTCTALYPDLRYLYSGPARTDVFPVSQVPTKQGQDTEPKGVDDKRVPLD